MEDYRREREEYRKNLRKRKRTIRKNLVIIAEAVVIVALSVALVVVGTKYKNLSDNGTASVVPDVSSGQSISVESGGSDGSDASVLSDSGVGTQSGTVSSAPEKSSELDKWYMVLVNPDHTVSKEYINKVDLAKIDEKFSSGAESSKYLDSRAVGYFNDMCKAALKDGISLIAVSSYRTYDYQLKLFNNRVKRCENEGYDSEKAKEVAATIVAQPGTSEHHLGLAVDINSVEESFENSKAYKWLQNNAADYGFVMRYAKDKQDITKIIYEPWHYRYVGAEHAKKMNKLGMCLEEYIEYLKK